jgi:hypothetical protein
MHFARTLQLRFIWFSRQTAIIFLVGFCSGVTASRMGRDDSKMIALH